MTFWRMCRISHPQLDNISLLIAKNLKKMVKMVDIDRIRSGVNRIKTIFTQFKNNVFKKMIARLAILLP